MHEWVSYKPATGQALACEPKRFQLSRRKPSTDEQQQLLEEVLKRNDALQDENNLLKERLKLRDEKLVELERKMERYVTWARDVRESGEMLEAELSGDSGDRFEEAALYKASMRTSG